jgi:hypothetical protein
MALDKGYSAKIKEIFLIDKQTVIFSVEFFGRSVLHFFFHLLVLNRKKSVSLHLVQPRIRDFYGK